MARRPILTCRGALRATRIHHRLILQKSGSMPFLTERTINQFRVFRLYRYAKLNKCGKAVAKRICLDSVPNWL